MTLVYLVAAWIAGIILGPSVESPSLVWIALALVAFALAWIVRRRTPHRLTLICVGLACFGVARYDLAVARLTPADVGYYADSGYVTLTGVISQDPDIRSQHINLRVDVQTMTQKSSAAPVRGSVLVQTFRYGEYAYGDRVVVSGSLLTPPEFDTFSYRDYLARQNIHATILNARVQVVAHGQGKPWYVLIYNTKDRAQQVIDRLLPSPQAPLLSGILLGVETAISDSVREAFNRTGTTHIIAISGANIIIILRTLMGVFAPLAGRRRAIWLALASVGAYTVLVGGDPSVVRAAIMGSLALIAARLGRKAYGLTTLAFSILMMTLFNPMILWDIGFQLSVAATTGLVLFSQDFEHFLERLLRQVFAQPTARQITQWLSEPVAVSLAAQITTTPLILFYFGRLSIVGLAANLLIVPVQPFIMIGGWIAAVCGLFWMPIGQLAAWLVWIPLTYTLEIVRALGTLSWASVEITITRSATWITYACLLCVMLIKIQHPADRARLARRIKQQIKPSLVMLAGVAIAVLVWMFALSQPSGKLHVWFLDVGHGNAILIRTPNGAHMLVDGGPNPTRLRQTVGDHMPFWNRTLDLLILTQPTRSVIGAVPELLQHYTARLTLTNGQPSEQDEYKVLVTQLNDQGSDMLNVVAGHQIVTSDDVTLEVLHPQRVPAGEDDADTVSVVLRLSYGNTSFLIAPDVSVEGERELMESGQYIGSTVLILPAHGGEKQNSLEFLQAVQPKAAIASVGAGNRASLPSSVAVERLSSIASQPVFRTDKQGTVEMVTDGKTLWIYPEH